MYFHLSYRFISKITSYTLTNELDYTISIPPLKSRSLKERFDLIKMFLNQEAKQIQCSIQLANTVLHSLLLYECSGQIKELKMIFIMLVLTAMYVFKKMKDILNCFFLIFQIM